MIRMYGCEKGWESSHPDSVSTERDTRFELATSSLGSWIHDVEDRYFSENSGPDRDGAGPCRPLVGLAGVGERVGACVMGRWDGRNEPAVHVARLRSEAAPPAEFWRCSMCNGDHPRGVSHGEATRASEAFLAGRASAEAPFAVGDRVRISPDFPGDGKGQMATVAYVCVDHDGDLFVDPDGLVGRIRAGASWLSRESPQITNHDTNTEGESK